MCIFIYAQVVLMRMPANLSKMHRKPTHTTRARADNRGMSVVRTQGTGRGELMNLDRWTQLA
jgi:hypothetical protein